MTDIIYDSYMERESKGEHDLENDTIKIALLKNTHTPDQTDDVWADISGDENPGGDGYTAGGFTLANVAVAALKIDADDPVWTTLTATNLRYAAIYNFTHASDALIYLLDFGADKSPTAENFQIQFDTDGIFTKQQGS